jgi:hypothetical protein
MSNRVHEQLQPLGARERNLRERFKLAVFLVLGMSATVLLGVLLYKARPPAATTTSEWRQKLTNADSAIDP